MAYLQLLPHVSYGLVGDRPVFLDLARDRYLVLPARSEQAFREFCAGGEPVLSDGPDRDLLLGTGLFRTGSLRGRGLTAATIAPGSASLLDDSPRPRAGLRATLAARASVRYARRQLATRSLRDIVDAIRERRNIAHPGESRSTVVGAARLFLAARARLPVEPRCLLDCLALLDWLGDDAPSATLVFGVRLDPFAAHCWLQTDRLLLTDAAEAVRTFTPVLAV